MLDNLNKININPKRDKRGQLSVLWITASNADNRNTLTFRNHNHAYYEIHIIREGALVYGFGDEEVSVSNGEFIVIEPYLDHRVIRHSEKFFKVSLAFEISDKNAFFGENFDEKWSMLATPAEIENSLIYLSESRKSYKTFGEDILESRLEEIVYIIADKISDSCSIKEGDHDGRMFRIKKYIEDNPSTFFTCGEIASFCHLSEKQLSRIFLKYEGKSLLSYIHDQKIELAKKLLSESDETQEAIALSIGFSSVHYFNKFFLRHTSLSPGDFRTKSN